MSSWLLGVSFFVFCFSSVSVYNCFGLRNKLRDGPLRNEKARLFFSAHLEKHGLPTRTGSLPQRPYAHWWREPVEHVLLPEEGGDLGKGEKGMRAGVGGHP